MVVGAISFGQKHGSWGEFVQLEQCFSGDMYTNWPKSGNELNARFPSHFRLTS